MKIICIYNRFDDVSFKYTYVNLTYGKTYTVAGVDESHIYITDDSGEVRGYNKDLFTTVEDWRDDQLNSIL